ncbi:malate dehydrogenase [Anopheles darlingi]|uniref:Malate dehydrogenase n=1 Tax=Anopheles darlingi TaxID=43151 RepID=W5JGY0_ANODA|nr:malate dehydrogenase [Anopheles darlingi]
MGTACKPVPLKKTPPSPVVRYLCPPSSSTLHARTMLATTSSSLVSFLRRAPTPQWHVSVGVAQGMCARQIHTLLVLLEPVVPHQSVVGQRSWNTQKRKQYYQHRASSGTLGSNSSRTMSVAASKQGLVALEEARRFMVDCLVKSKTPLSHAQQQADLLAEADYRGHFSHGMNRLEMYINDLHKNACDGAAVPTILNETPATAWVDGNNGLGAVVGNFCMDLAIKKAKEVGVGWVCAKRSNHYGIAGWYTLRAMKAGCIGMSMTNTSPLASPTRSKEAALGTNPISVGAPAKDGDGFVLDMATTAVAVGKIEMQRRKNEPIPHGWAQGPDGHPTTDASVAFDTACLMPLGGSELTSGYKGYGLGAMVEMFCGVLAGANYATKIRKWTHAGADSEADLGQCFVAINPACFAPGFEDRLSDMNGILRNMPTTDPTLPVLVAGDPERHHMEKVDKDGGLAYHVNQIKTCTELSERLGVKPIVLV